MCVSTTRGVSLRATRICTGYSCGGILAHFFAALTWNFIRRSSKKCLTTSSPATASHLSCHSQLAGLLGDRCSRDVGAITTKKKLTRGKSACWPFTGRCLSNWCRGPESITLRRGQWVSRKTLPSWVLAPHLHTAVKDGEEESRWVWSGTPNRQQSPA